MLEVLQDLIKQHGQGAVVNNPEVPNEHNEGVQQEVMDQILGGLQNQASKSGGMGDLLGMIMGGAAAGQAGNPNQQGGGLANVLGGLLGGGANQQSQQGGGLGDLLGGLMGGGNQQNQQGGGLGALLGGLMGGGANQQNQQGGGLGDLLGGLVGSGNQPQNQQSVLSNNPIVGSIMQSVIGSLMSKFGLSNGAASGVAGSMIPSVLGGLLNKAGDSNDSSVDLSSILNVLTKGQTQGMDLNSVLGKAGSVMQDGKLDMSDLIRIASGR